MLFFVRGALATAVFTVVMVGFSAGARGDEPARAATAFYYGARVPRELLSHFDRIVVEPDNVPSPPAGARAKPFAYVSVGEVNPNRPWRSRVPGALVLGKNPSWGTDIVDTRSPAWRDFLLDSVVEPLYARGYRGLFLDALDSYVLVTRDPHERSLHAAGIAAIVAAIRQRHPDLAILLNRGFDVLPLLDRPPEGLVAESLFRTAGGGEHDFREVSIADSTRLLRILQGVRAKWPIPITVLDYVPASERELRRATALRIWQAGFDPYVATPALDGLGTGRVEIVPRRVLLVYKNNPEEGYLGQQDACVLLAPILEWMGYAVDYADVATAPPAADLGGRYAGVVTLVPEGVDDASGYRRWLLQQIDAGVRVAFIDGFGFEPDAAFLGRLGLIAAGAAARAPMRVVSSSPYLGFEAPVRPEARELPPVSAADPAVRSLLRLQDADDATWDGVVLGPWGGAAFAPYVIEEGLEQERRWILDPFRFLHDALGLEPIPAPDVTTESGRRILTIHVDGDAFVSRAERRDAPFAGQVVLDEVLAKYPVPHTVSVVEGEIGSAGLYPADSPKLEAIAREIFRLPYVEAGSHTFSHPFVWADAESGHHGSSPVALPVPNYHFSLERELRGSIAYIQSRLLPPGKRVRVLQWPGDCSPSARAVAYAQELGVENVNGGGSTRTADFPSLTRGSAMGIPKAEGVYQVFAPVENENVYTDDWQGPFYGYSRVIETFELNEKPRRLSPISIYYHFYSGTKAASLAALKQVYDWAMKEETNRLFLSEYAAKVRAFQNVSLARRVDDGGWELGDLGDLRTVRLDPGWGWPDMARSVGVAGVREVSQGRYVHLARDAEPVLYAAPNRPGTPYLESTNGRVLRWERGAGTWLVHVVSHEPVVLHIGGAQACALKRPGGWTTATRDGMSLRLATDSSDTGEATLECK